MSNGNLVQKKKKSQGPTPRAKKSLRELNVFYTQELNRKASHALLSEMVKAEYPLSIFYEETRQLLELP